MYYEIFKIKEFRRWLGARFFSNVAKQMEVLVVSWQIYQRTKSPLALGLVGFSQALPYVAVALWAGHAADHYEKKKQISGSLSALLMCSASLWALSIFWLGSILPIYIVLGLAGTLVSFEQAASMSYLQMVMPQKEYSKAIAWNLALFQTATIGGPILGGFIVDRWSIPAGFAVVVGCYAVSAAISFGLRPVHPTTTTENMSQWQSIKQGLRFLKNNEVMWACMVLDMLGVFFGDVIAILPIFATMLGAGAIGLGALRSAPALGSLVMSTVEAHRAFIRISWRNFVRTVSVFGLCVIAFALSKSFWLSFFFLAAGGMADAISVVIRQSVYRRFTPDHMRGRMASVSGIFIRSSNELGAFESGLAAQLLGAVPSVIVGGSLTLLFALIMKYKFRRLDWQETA